MEQQFATKNKVVSSLVWKFLERGGVQGVQFVLSVMLARLVTPSDYGVVALLLVFVQIANVFIQSGFSTALIQKRDADDRDFSSVLFLSLFVAAVLYAVLFFVSPLVARFYGQPVLKPMLRVISVTLFFGAVNSVQGAYVSRTMQFKRFFFSSMGAAVLSGIVGVGFAYRGYGAWALVFQQLVNAAVICLILWFTVMWRPRVVFSFVRVRQLFGFGWKLLCSALLDTVFRNAYSLVIGRLYSSGQLGMFNRGQQFPQVIAVNLDGSIQSVMLPALSARNDSVPEVKRLVRRSISTSAYILMPCMFGLAAVAETLVRIVLTEKWMECVPFLQLACISYALYPVHTANLTGINALGRSDIFLKLEIAKKILTVCVLLLTVPLGITAMAAGQVVCGFVSTFINAWPNKKLMGYSYWEQWRDLLPPFVLSVVMAVAVWCLRFVLVSDTLLLAVQVVAGIVFYVMMSRLFRLEAYDYFV
ncbi:MAG: lipopolysaccharide biosynthesis protein, partial [Treponema sp.]|nr:lipopolysaccharide biosynthesis protein [Treponema sp.]